MSTDVTRQDLSAADESSPPLFEAEIQYAPASDARERLRRIFVILSRARSDVEDRDGSRFKRLQHESGTTRTERD